MSYFPPKCRHTFSALQAWLTHLDWNWEKSFGLEVLNLGRKLYKQHQISALDIQEQSLLVEAKAEDRRAALQYSIIDVIDKEKWEFRASFEDPLFKSALAVAGLYELEEFLSSDEVLDFFQRETQVSSSPLASVPPKTQDSEPLQSKKSHLNKEIDNKKARRLALIFRTLPKGISFFPVFSESNTRLSGKEVWAHPKEREDWIRLSHWARKEGFIWNSKQGKYLLEGDIKVIQAFFNNCIKDWQVHYKIELPDALKALQSGKKILRLSSVLHKKQEGLEVHPTAELGGAQLSLDELKLVLHQGGEAILNKHGWVGLNIEEKSLLEDWESYFLKKNSGPWPIYMLFSNFVRRTEGKELQSEIRAWKKGLDDFKKEQANSHLPHFLRPYQKDAVTWMQRIFEWGGHVLLADEMGLGKTVQVLALLYGGTPSQVETTKPQLVVCPASVLPVWKQEIEKFFPKVQVEVLKQDNICQAGCGPHLWLSSYTQLRRQRSMMAQVEFSYVILDEAQAIKNPHSKTAQAIYALKAERRIAITGTPIENRHLDLWSVLRFLMPGLLGSRKTFEGTLLKEDGVAQLKAQLAPFILRRMKADLLTELPNKTELLLPCPLTHLQKTLYKQIAEEGCLRFPEGFGSGQERLGVLAILMRLRQVICDPSLLPEAPAYPFLESGKLTLLAERVIELIDNGEKVVIFSQFVRLLNRIHSLFSELMPELACYELTGQSIDRAEPVRAFQSHEGPALMLASLRAAGAGITLHAASYVFLMDPWWNPAVEAQAVDRVHRMGQKKPVFVYRLIAEGSIEEKIQALKAHKQGLFDSMLDELPNLNALEEHFGHLAKWIELDEEKD